jgi:hypothetical protein
MKTLILDVYSAEVDRNYTKEIDIDDQFFNLLTLPYKKWGDDMEKYNINENDYYNKVYELQDLMLTSIVDFYFSTNYYDLVDQVINRDIIQFSIEIDQ